MGKNYSSVTINIIPEFRSFFTISLDGSHLAKDNYLIGNLTQPPHQLIHVDQHFSELKFMLLLDPYRTPISRIYQSHFSSRVNNGQRNVIMICSSNSLVPSLCNQMTTLMFQLILHPCAQVSSTIAKRNVLEIFSPTFLVPSLCTQTNTFMFELMSGRLF